MGQLNDALGQIGRHFSDPSHHTDSDHDSISASELRSTRGKISADVDNFLDAYAVDPTLYATARAATQEGRFFGDAQLSVADVNALAQGGTPAAQTLYSQVASVNQTIDSNRANTQGSWQQQLDGSLSAFANSTAHSHPLVLSLKGALKGGLQNAVADDSSSAGIAQRMLHVSRQPVRRSDTGVIVAALGRAAQATPEVPIATEAEAVAQFDALMQQWADEMANKSNGNVAMFRRAVLDGLKTETTGNFRQDLSARYWAMSESIRQNGNAFHSGSAEAFAAAATSLQ